MSIEAKLTEMGITLPSPPKPVGAYIPVTQTGNLCYVSGQIPISEGVLVYAGSVPGDLTVEDAIMAARICAINILGQLNGYLGSLDRIKKVVRINGFIQSSPGFHDQASVLNGASDFLAEVLGDAGVHTRTAYGVLALPVNATVEIDAIVEID